MIKPHPLVLLLLIWMAAGTGPAGADSYFPCRSCHGDQGLGSPAINAPPLAGQLEGYLARQLANFREGIRGDRSGDTYGRQMALMAATLDDAGIAELARTLAAMAPWPRKSTDSQPTPGAGGKLYQPCAACHGAEGEGNAVLLAPRIRGMDARYLARQLRNFRDGIRGATPADTAGQTMRAALPTSLDEASIETISSYIENM